MRLVPLGTIRIPRLRRGRRPRRPASFVLGSKNTDRHTSVATLVCDDRPSACALRACGPAGEGLASPTACSSPSGGGCRLRQVEGAGPYDADGRFPVGSDPRIAPPTCADVRQAGRRGRRPLRCGRTFPRRGGACPSRRPCMRVRQAGRRGRRPLRCRLAFPRRGDSRIARRHASMSDKRAGNTRPYAADGLASPSGGIAASRCQWQMKRSRNFRSGRKTQANKRMCAAFFGHRKAEVSAACNARR